MHVFLRDFDLIHIGHDASVGGELYARRFEASSIVHLPISIGSGSDVGANAVVYGGARVRNGRYGRHALD